MAEKNIVDRRGFLKCSATAIALPFISSVNAFSSTSNSKTDSEKKVYQTAKQVYDLAEKAWDPERYGRKIHGGVIGILNLNSTGPDYDGPGKYLHLRRDDTQDRTQLDLTLIVGDIDKKTTKEIDGHLSNLGLRYTPRIKGINQDYVAEIHRKADFWGGVTSTVASIFSIWDDRILGYAKEHHLPVLELCSFNLTNLYSIGYAEDGNKIDYSDKTYSNLENIPEDAIELIIRTKYVPLLIRTIPQLERELERVNAIRSDEKQVAYEKQLESLVVLERKKGKIKETEDRIRKRVSESTVARKVLESEVE